jgi:transposase-like protein
MDKTISKANIAQCESEWRERLARHAVSGQTVAVFCKNESITEGQFYRWRARIRDQAGVAVRARNAAPASAPFIDLGAVKAPNVNGATSRADQMSAAKPDSIEVHLDLGHGLVLHIVRH